MCLAAACVDIDKRRAMYDLPLAVAPEKRITRGQLEKCASYINRYLQIRDFNNFPPSRRQALQRACPVAQRRARGGLRMCCTCEPLNEQVHTCNTRILPEMCCCTGSQLRRARRPSQVKTGHGRPPRSAKSRQRSRSALRRSWALSRRRHGKCWTRWTSWTCSRLHPFCRGQNRPWKAAGRTLVRCCRCMCSFSSGCAAELIVMRMPCSPAEFCRIPTLQHWPCRKPTVNYLKA